MTSSHFPRHEPFIYWDPDYTYFACAKLIGKYLALQQMADNKEFYQGKHDTSKKWGQIVKTASNNERSTQIRVIKAVWLNVKSPISFVQAGDPTTAIVELAERLSEREDIHSVEDVRDLLMSPFMYQNEDMYDLFCTGLESGQFKNTSQQGMTTISDLITPSHEAHFRMELWWALPHAGDFRHAITKEHAEIRIEKWKALLPIIMEDRTNNESEAHQLRSTYYVQSGGIRKASELPDNRNDKAAQEYWG